MKLPALAAALLSAAPLVAAAPQNQPGTVAIYSRTTLNRGDVRVFDEATGWTLATPPELKGIQILPIDFVGRTEMLEFMSDRPRYRADVPSASRLVLPRAQGSLYRYSRDTAEGRVFGKTLRSQLLDGFLGGQAGK